MGATAPDTWIGLFLALVVFGLFIFSAALRIKNAWMKIHETGQSPKTVSLGKVDIIFSGIFLASSFIILVIVVLNYGH